MTLLVEHSLKTDAVCWDAIESGARAFDVRRNDRCFQKGDRVLLRRWEPDVYFLGSAGAYTRQKTGPDDPYCDHTDVASSAKTLRYTVSYVLPGGEFGIEAGYVVLGLRDEG